VEKKVIDALIPGMFDTTKGAAELVISGLPSLTVITGVSSKIGSTVTTKIDDTNKFATITNPAAATCDGTNTSSGALSVFAAAGVAIASLALIYWVQQDLVSSKEIRQTKMCRNKNTNAP